MTPQHEHQPPASEKDFPSLGDDDLDKWKDRVAALPDLRLAKVLRIRRAIITDCYEEESLLDKTIGNLHNDIGVLCRGDHAQ